MSKKLYESLKITIARGDVKRTKQLIKLAESRGIDLSEAPGAIRKGIAAVAAAGAILHGANVTGAKQFPVYQAMKTEYQQAMDAGDKARAKEIKQDIDRLLVFVDTGKGNAPAELARKYDKHLTVESQVMRSIVKLSPKAFEKHGLVKVSESVKRAIQMHSRSNTISSNQKIAATAFKILEGSLVNQSQLIKTRKQIVRDTKRVFFETGKPSDKKKYMQAVKKLDEAQQSQ